MTRARYTLGDVSGSLTPEKRKDEWRGEWAAALIYRPIGNLLTVALLRLPVSANQITLAGLIMAIALPFIALRTPGSGYILVGGIGVLIAILDCVDGNIARITASESAYGRYLDALTDVMARAGLFAALGILIDRSLQAPAWMAGFGLLYCLGGVLFFYLARLSRLFARQFAGEEKPGPTASGFIDRILFPFFSGLDWALPILILIAGMFDVLGWVALWLFVYSVLDFLYTQYAVLKRLA